MKNIKFVPLFAFCFSLLCAIFTARAADNDFAKFFVVGTDGAATWAVTNPAPPAPAPTNSSAIPGLSGIESVIITNLIDDLPYISNATVGVDFAVLYNESNPKGTGKVGFFGDIVLPTSQQTAVGIGAGEVAHRSFITPVNFTIGTTLEHLPAAIGKVYSFASDGILYDFSGKEVGNWASVGFFKNWTINQHVNIGLKFGSYSDSVLPGIGWFGALAGTF